MDRASSREPGLNSSVEIPFGTTWTPRAIEEVGTNRSVDLLLRRDHRLAGPEANDDVERDEVPDREPGQVLRFTDPWLQPRFVEAAPYRRSRKPEVVAVDLGRDGDAAVNSPSQEAERARRLAVHDVERPRGVKLFEGIG